MALSVYPLQSIKVKGSGWRLTLIHVGQRNINSLAMITINSLSFVETTVSHYSHIRALFVVNFDRIATSQFSQVSKDALHEHLQFLVYLISKLVDISRVECLSTILRFRRKIVRFLYSIVQLGAIDDRSNLQSHAETEF